MQAVAIDSSVQTKKCMTCGKEKPLNEFEIVVNKTFSEDCKECRRGKHFTEVFKDDVLMQKKAREFLSRLKYYAIIAHDNGIKPDISNFIAEYSVLYGSAGYGLRMIPVSEYRWKNIEYLLSKGVPFYEIANAYGISGEVLKANFLYRQKRRQRNEHRISRER